MIYDYQSSIQSITATTALTGNLIGIEIQITITAEQYKSRRHKDVSDQHELVLLHVLHFGQALPEESHRLLEMSQHCKSQVMTKFSRLQTL